MNVERRFSQGSIRADRTEGTPSLSGYAAVFNSDYVLFEDARFRVIERIQPGAFDGVMDADVRCLFNHDPNSLLGRTTNGTLDLAQDANGLKFRARLNTATHIASDVREMVKRGDVTGCSFGFIVAEDEYPSTSPDPDGREVLLRVITKIGQLFDVGPVTYPAYEATSVQAREQLPAEIRARIAPPQADFLADVDAYLRNLPELSEEEVGVIERQRASEELLAELKQV